MNDDNNLDFLKMTARSTEPSKELVERELLVF